MAEGDRGYPRRSWAFLHAVRCEREAIAAHEAAATRHEEMAVALEQRAALVQDERVRASFLRLAEQCRIRSVAALGRAETAKSRLRSEGIDPD
jgi:hypothetical protein